MPSRHTVAFVLSEKHKAIVDRLASEQGMSSASAALRRIIDEWDTGRAQAKRAAADVPLYERLGPAAPGTVEITAEELRDARGTR